MKNRKLVITIFAVIIFLLTLVALVPLVISIVAGSGVQTGGVDDARAKEASVDLDGQWHVVQGDAKNFSSAGFTFNETLPAEKTTTSGTTNSVDGSATISSNVLEQASVVVKMDTLTTDKQVRDKNMKMKLFKTDQYPEAKFELTKPVDLSQVPADGTSGTVTVTGDLSIKDKTNEVSGDMDVLRDGDKLIIGGSIEIDRTDFDVNTPDFLAAKIAEVGLVEVRVTMRKDS